MVRVVMRGGVWKNAEDETLKAGVMKYGMNQWGRVASLLSRKSAKQCKARWLEWLDPSIKKTEWTKNEDEKLLHLAKLMPTQWRTIAPLVGRTATQCLERYERLLDAAVGNDAAGGDDDPRRLRPGEIDPHPETKPAKPDPVDMEDDELEMLAEARARLANTKGKKAKRKQRERMLEEARRLATLQKKRELVAAGIDEAPKRKRKKLLQDDIDHATEVALETHVPAGFYDTAQERAETAAAAARAARGVGFKPTTIAELEGKRANLTQDERRKEAQRKAALAEQRDLPEALRRQAERDAALTSAADGTRLRGKLVLPEPTVGDAELREVARARAAAEAAAAQDAGFATPFVGMHIA